MILKDEIVQSIKKWKHWRHSKVYFALKQGT